MCREFQLPGQKTCKTNRVLKKSQKDENPEVCFGKGYPKAAARVKLIKTLAAKAGEPWISFYRNDEIETVLLQNGYAIKENLTLEDLNSQYFTPVGRTLPENYLFNLEHFVIAKSLS